MIENKFVRFSSYLNYLNALADQGISQDSIIFVNDLDPSKRLIHANGADYFSSQPLDSYVDAVDWSPVPKLQTPIIEQGEANLIVIYNNSYDINVNIYYTLDGSTPTASATLYEGSFTLNQPATIKAIAIESNHNDSDIATYDRQYARIPSPTFSVIDNTMTIGWVGQDTEVQYTTDGSDPTHDNIYTEPFEIPFGTEVIKAKSVAPGYLDSLIVTYTV